MTKPAAQLFAITFFNDKKATTSIDFTRPKSVTRKDVVTKITLTDNAVEFIPLIFSIAQGRSDTPLMFQLGQVFDTVIGKKPPDAETKKAKLFLCEHPIGIKKRRRVSLHLGSWKSAQSERAAAVYPLLALTSTPYPLCIFLQLYKYPGTHEGFKSLIECVATAALTVKPTIA